MPLEKSSLLPQRMRRRPTFGGFRGQIPVSPAQPWQTIEREGLVRLVKVYMTNVTGKLTGS